MHLCLRATVSKCIYLSLLDASPPASPFTTTFTLTTTVTFPCIFLHKPSRRSRRSRAFEREGQTRGSRAQVLATAPDRV